MMAYPNPLIVTGKSYVVEEDNQILGAYYIKTNQGGPGSHVCNCGYMVSSKAQGKGLATAMYEHSQKALKGTEEYSGSE